MITPQHSNLRRVKRIAFARREPDTFASCAAIHWSACVCQTVHRLESKHWISALISNHVEGIVERYVEIKFILWCSFQRRYAALKTVEDMAWWRCDENSAIKGAYFYLTSFIYCTIIRITRFLILRTSGYEGCRRRRFHHVNSSVLSFKSVASASSDKILKSATTCKEL